MMDEYLWNKTGSDPRIEQIEAALKSLAYQPASPPTLSAKEFSFSTRRSWLFRLTLGFATGLLALVALTSAWFLLRDERPATQQSAVKTVPEAFVTAVRTEGATPSVAALRKVSKPDKPRRVVAPRQPVSSSIRPQTLVLTKEEADAYRQLMTALSITSTNLKIVKDKLNGTE